MHEVGNRWDTIPVFPIANGVVWNIDEYSEGSHNPIGCSINTHVYDVGEALTGRCCLDIVRGSDSITDRDRCL
jgi:hypothetical protein